MLSIAMNILNLDLILKTAQIVATALFAIATIIITIVVARVKVNLAKDIEQSRVRSDARQHVFRVSRELMSVHYYTQVTAPVWEVYIKWKYWTGADGDQYRVSVVTGFLDYHEKYHDFRSADQLDRSGHNIIRFGDHYHPSDYIQSTLSEHQALTKWLEDWGHVGAMIQCGSMDKELARRIFKDWYQYWVGLMIELRACVSKAYEDKYKSRSEWDLEVEPRPQWIDELSMLEKFFFADNHGKMPAWYSEKMNAGSSRVLTVVQTLADSKS